MIAESYLIISLILHHLIVTIENLAQYFIQFLSRVAEICLVLAID